MPPYLEQQDLCASLTRMQEHMLKDCCCKYCDQTFSTRTEKLSHRRVESSVFHESQDKETEAADQREYVENKQQQ